jgi:hypothetical protein
MTKPDLETSYSRYHTGEPLSDTEVQQLIDAIDAAIPYLEVTLQYRLVLNDLLADRRMLVGYQEARKSA